MAVGSPRGTYLTIAEALRTQLKSEQPPGTLPSEAALMDEYGVARTTVRRALKALEADGLVVARHGVGWEPAHSGLDRRPLVERIVEKIRIDGLQPGDRFPSEAELCNTFGFSRPAVRNALAQLEGKGLLEAVPGKGRWLRSMPSPDLTS